MLGQYIDLYLTFLRHRLYAELHMTPIESNYSLSPTIFPFLRRYIIPEDGLGNSFRGIKSFLIAWQEE